MMFGFQVPSQDKYISIRVGQDNRANLTITLSRRTNQTSEVVFSYSRAQVLKTPQAIKHASCYHESRKILIYR